MKPWNEVASIAYLAVGFVMLIWLAKAIVFRLWDRPGMPADVRRAIDEETHRALLDASPKCICGEQATQPMPILNRSRGASNYVREWFAMPPRYRRVVNPMGLPMLCASHAHVADAVLDHFIHNRVRAVLSEASARVAVEAAGFEQEGLLQKIADGLTDRQKRTTRGSMSPVRVLPRTGTETDRVE